MLGLFFLFNIKLKQFTLPASVVLLVAFTVYLVYELITEGNEGNCGCFGTYLQMTPIESFIKNVGLLLVIILLWKMCQAATYRFMNWVATFSVAAAFSLPFILNPVDVLNAKNLQPETANFPLQKDLIVERKHFWGAYRGSFYREAHCSIYVSHLPILQARAFKIHVIHERHPEISFFFFLNGKEENVDEFFAETKSVTLNTLE
jgi:hypothetical protein